MCGIAGIVSDDPMRIDEMVHDMVDSIKYRGPDESGFYIDEDIGLGHARLSIMDPQNGKQPTANEEESIVVIFNGEIYNHEILRKELLKKGHRFTNQSDTVILPHLYEEYGVGMFEKLNGQFAIALWDKRNKRLLLARDRFGEKPLYYCRKGRNFCFASEAKAILKSRLLHAEISPIALKQVFTFWTTLGDRSMFQQIAQIPAGCYLTWENQKTEIKTYYRFTYTRHPSIDSMNPNDLTDALEEKLIAAVRNRMISDVPISFYLSGGLDSSLLAGIAAGLTGGSLRTFSIGFDDSGYDETAYQDIMARHLGTMHQSVRFSKKQIPAMIRDVIYHTEVPLLRSGVFPMYALAGLVRRNGIKVVLSGEGSDELFGGYDIFKEVKIREYCRNNPNSVLRGALYKRVNTYVKGLSNQPASQLALHYGMDTQSRFSSHLTRWKLGAYSRQFFTPDFREEMDRYDELASLEEHMPREYSLWTQIQRAQYLEVETLLSNYLLSSQGDRVSMGSGVECRYPFLDYQVAEFAASLPDNMKLKGLNEKYIIKKIARKYVPDVIAKRTKFPYRAPVSIAELWKDDYTGSLLSFDQLKRYGIFHPGTTEKFLSSILRKEDGSERDCMLFMGIMTTQILCERFLN